jgi:ProP effector
MSPDSVPPAAPGLAASEPEPEASALPTVPVESAVPAAVAAVVTVGTDAPATPTAPAVHPNPAACAQQLKQLFPALFAGAPKPLKLRIQVDIQERAPGVFTKQALSAFFRRYTGSTAYLIAVSRARQRFDLDGQPNGELSDEHRQMALDELARRRANNESRIALEEQQRRNRATLLHDFQSTTLTRANFCALKGIAVEELDGYLATARREAEERAQHQQNPQNPQHPPAIEARRPQGRHPSGQRQGPGPGQGRR